MDQALGAPGWWTRLARLVAPAEPPPLHAGLAALRRATGQVGPPVDLEALRGRVVLVAFFVHDCVRCAAAMPVAQALHARYRAQGLAVVGVHEPAFGRDARVEVAQAVRRLGVTFPVVLDARSAVWDAFKNRFWPAHYLVGRDGRLLHVQYGDDHPDALEAKVREALNAS